MFTASVGALAFYNFGHGETAQATAEPGVVVRPLTGAEQLRAWEPPNAEAAFNRVVTVNNSARTRLNFVSTSSAGLAANASYWGELADAARTAKLEIDAAKPAPFDARAVVGSLRQSLGVLGSQARGAGNCGLSSLCGSRPPAANASICSRPRTASTNGSSISADRGSGSIRRLGPERPGPATGGFRVRKSSRWP